MSFILVMSFVVFGGDLQFVDHWTDEVRVPNMPSTKITRFLVTMEIKLKKKKNKSFRINLTVGYKSCFMLDCIC